MNTPARPSHRTRAWRWLGHAASAAGLLVLAVLPGHKYGWMEDIDPAIDPAALEDGSGNRVVFATLVLLLAVGLQALGWWLAAPGAGVGAGARRHLLPGLCIAALLAVWAWKFWL